MQMYILYRTATVTQYYFLRNLTLSPKSPMSHHDTTTDDTNDETDTSPGASNLSRAKSIIRMKESKTVTNLRKRFN